LKYTTTHRTPPGMQTLTTVRRRGWSGRIVSLPLSFFSFFCFLCQGHRSHGESDLDQWGLKTRRTAQDSAFWGSERCAPKFRGVKSPKNWNFGGVNRTFKPEREKIQILLTWKLLSRSWQNLYWRYAPRMWFRGWSNDSPKQIKDGGGHHL